VVVPVWLVVLEPVVLEPVVRLRFVRLTVDVAVMARIRSWEAAIIAELYPVINLEVTLVPEHRSR